MNLTENWRRYLAGEIHYLTVGDLEPGAYFQFLWQIEDAKAGIISAAAVFQLVEKSVGRAAYRSANGSAVERTHFIARDADGQMKTIDFVKATAEERAMALGTQVVPYTGVPTSEFETTGFDRSNP